MYTNKNFEGHGNEINFQFFYKSVQNTLGYFTQLLNPLLFLL
jgi:hypothetical protein